MNDRICVADHEEGRLLRLQAPESYAMDAAAKLLGFFESELEAAIESEGLRPRHGLKTADPVAVYLEGLQIELSTDGNGVELRRVEGGEGAFEELCALVIAECLDS